MTTSALLAVASTAPPATAQDKSHHDDRPAADSPTLKTKRDQRSNKPFLIAASSALLLCRSPSTSEAFGVSPVAVVPRRLASSSATSNPPVAFGAVHRVGSFPEYAKRASSSCLNNSYLDAVSKECDVNAPSAACASAIASYLESLSTGESRVDPSGVAALTSFVDGLNPGANPYGKPTPSSREAVGTYLDALSEGTIKSPSSGAVSSYLDAMSSGALIKPSSGASIASNLSTFEGAAVGTVATAATGAPPTDQPYRGRNDKVAAAAGAGESRWSQSEILRIAQADGGQAGPTPAVDGGGLGIAPDAPGPVDTSVVEAADHGLRSDDGVGGPTLLERVSQGASAVETGVGTPEAVKMVGATTATASFPTTDQLYSIRNRKVQATAKAGKSRWSESELLRISREAIGYAGPPPFVSGGGPSVAPYGPGSADPAAMEAADHGLRNDGGVGGPTLADRVTLGSSVPAVGPPGAALAGLRLSDVLGACDTNEPSTKCASAIASYLADISKGESEPAPEGATAIASYLDGLTNKGPASGAAITSYLGALAAGAAEPPTPGALTSYFTALADENVSKPSSAASIVYNLLEYDLMTTRSSQAPEPATAAMTPQEPTPESTATTTSASPSTGSYLDALSQECDGDASPQECAPAITSYLDALSSGATRPSEAGAAGITSYLDAIAGVSSSEQTMGASTGKAIASYLDSLSSGDAVAPSTAAVTSYLDALSSREVQPPSAAESISSYVSGEPGADVTTSVSSDAKAKGDVEAVPEPAQAPPPPSDVVGVKGDDENDEVDRDRRAVILSFGAVALAAVGTITPVAPPSSNVEAEKKREKAVASENFFKYLKIQEEEAAEKQRKLEKQLETLRTAQKTGVIERREMEERQAKIEMERQAAAKAEREAAEKAAIEAKKLAEEKVAAEAKRIADEKAAAEAKRLAEEKAAAEAKKLADEKAAAEAKRLAEEKAADEAKRLEEEKAAAEAQRLADEQAVTEAKRLANEKAAAEAKRLAEEKAAAAETKMLAEGKAAAEVKGLADENASAEAKERSAAAPEGDGQVPGETFQERSEWPSTAYDAYLQRRASEP